MHGGGTSLSDGDSIMTRVQKKFWKTKQVFIKATGKKEDKYVVASDADLDAKLECFHSVQTTCMELLKVVEKYQQRISCMSREENELGLFLFHQAQHDWTKAGRMMETTGKALLSSAKLRQTLAAPLQRMHQDVGTFHREAIGDTLLTVTRMERARTEYRGALLWMQNVSQELDPDTYKQLEKFRKVQAQVRTTKVQFERLKNDVCQKVEVLDVSRCNMLSHSLNTYQATLLHFWEQTSQAMAAIQEAFRGCEPYKFTVLQDLQEPLEQQGEGNSEEGRRKHAEKMPAELLLSLGKEKPGDLVSDCVSINGNDEQSQDVASCFSLNSGEMPEREHSYAGAHHPFDHLDKTSTCNDLLPLTSDLQCQKQSDDLPHPLAPQIGPFGSSSTKLCGKVAHEQGIEDCEGLSSLQDLLSLGPTESAEFTCEWQDAFGTFNPRPAFSTAASAKPQTTCPVHPSGLAEFLPSQLLDYNFCSTGWSVPSLFHVPPIQSTWPADVVPPFLSSSMTAANVPRSLPQDMSSWFDLLADLDPLSNPDSIGCTTKDLLHT